MGTDSIAIALDKLCPDLISGKYEPKYKLLTIHFEKDEHGVHKVRGFKRKELDRNETIQTPNLFFNRAMGFQVSVDLYV